MKIAHPLVCLVAGAGLSACTTMSGIETMANCPGSSCDATVSVGSCTDIRVTPEPIVVARGNKPVMRWNLVTPGWTFTDNGVNIRDHFGEFEGKLKESGTRFKWKNKNSKPGRYKYDVVVTDGRQTCPWDPWIVNQ